MLDRAATAFLKPTMEAMARGLVQRGVGANAITFVGFGLGVCAAAAIGLGAMHLGLSLILASRWADGLDGAVARQTTPTDRGAFLDIALDFLFYASIPLAFAWSAPEQRALPAATLLAAFIGTGSSFLAFAVLAERRGFKSLAYPRKGFYFLGGLTEATETLLCFALMCLWPAQFAWWAYGFALLCAFTVATRLWAGWKMLGPV